MLTTVTIDKIKNYIEGVSYNIVRANESIEIEFKNFYPNSKIIVTGTINNNKKAYVEIDGLIKYQLELSVNEKAKEFTIEEINLV